MPCKIHSQTASEIGKVNNSNKHVTNVPTESKKVIQDCKNDPFHGVDQLGVGTSSFGSGSVFGPLVSTTG